MIKFLVPFFSLCFLVSCEKEAGEGGTSIIMGRVKVKNYNSDFTIKYSEYYSEGIDVYIIYGNDSIYSDDFETGIDGWYRFEYLNKGKYKVYAMSKDSTRSSASGSIPVIQEVFIDENRSTFIPDDIVIFD
ncbi:MAG: hypothetical protein ACOCWA_07115 [Bacteroidota bacterium]